jgi:F-type H+-transporting ATPase subunit delta
MRSSEIAKRYAKAIFELSVDQRSQEKVFSDLRALSQAFSSDKDLRGFLSSPTVAVAARVELLEKTLANKGVSKEALDFTLLLARRNRLALFPEVVHAFEVEADAANNVCRGVVSSAVTLSPAERQAIEAKVENVLKKKVIMSYQVDPKVIGGLRAQVGSYTFDDSISAHLTRMNEELKRRTV